MLTARQQDLGTGLILLIGYLNYRLPASSGPEKASGHMSKRILAWGDRASFEPSEVCLKLLGDGFMFFVQP